MFWDLGYLEGAYHEACLIPVENTINEYKLWTS